MCTKQEADLISESGSQCQVRACTTYKSPLPRTYICRQSFRNIIYLTHTTLQYFLIKITFLESLEQYRFGISQGVHPYLCYRVVSTAASILLGFSHICTAENHLVLISIRQHWVPKQGEPPPIPWLDTFYLRRLQVCLYMGKNSNIYSKSKQLCKYVAQHLGNPDKNVSELGCLGVNKEKSIRG